MRLNHGQVGDLKPGLFRGRLVGLILAFAALLIANIFVVVDYLSQREVSPHITTPVLEDDGEDDGEPVEILKELGTDRPTTYRIRPTLTYDEDVTQWEIVQRFSVHCYAVALALAHNGKYLSAGIGTDDPAGSLGGGSVVTFDIAQGRQVSLTTLGQHRVVSLSYDSNDTEVVVADEGGQIWLLSVNNGFAAKLLRRVDFPIFSVRFSRDGNDFIVCGRKGKIGVVPKDVDKPSKIIETWFAAHDRWTCDATQMEDGRFLVVGLDWDGQQRRFIFAELLDGTTGKSLQLLSIDEQRTLPGAISGDISIDGAFVVAGHGTHFTTFRINPPSALATRDGGLPPTTFSSLNSIPRVLDSRPLILIVDEESLSIVDGQTGIFMSSRKRAQAMRQRKPVVSRICHAMHFVAMTMDDDGVREEIAVFRVR